MSEVATTEPQELAISDEPVNDSTAMMVMIERAVRDPSVDVEKMERLMAMQERVMERQSIIDFNNAMAESQSEMSPIATNKKNDQTHSRYADLDAISKAIKPIYTRHGLVMSFGSDVSPMEGHYRITCCVSHIGGYSKDYHADIPSDLTGLKNTPNKTKVHAFGSTMTYGRRYLTMLIFDIQIGIDTDGNVPQTPQIITSDEMANLYNLLEDSHSDQAAFLAYYKVEKIEVFPCGNYRQAVAQLNKKISGAQNG